MKLKIWSILVFFVLVFVISSTGVNAYNDSQERFKGPGLEWLLKYVEKPYTITELDKIFRARDYMLTVSYVKGDFKKIGSFYGPGGVVRTHDNNLIYGADNIVNYFRALKEKKVAAVNFQAVSVFIDIDGKLAKKEKKQLEDRVFTIHEVVMITFDIEGSSFVELSSSTSYQHPWKTFR